MSKRTRLFLRDDGYPFMKIMKGRQWIGRVYVDKRGVYRSSIAGEPYGIGDSFEDAFRTAARAYIGRNPGNIVVVNKTSRWWDGPIDEEAVSSPAPRQTRSSSIPSPVIQPLDEARRAARAGEISVVTGLRKPDQRRPTTNAPAVQPAPRKASYDQPRAQGD